MDRTRFETAVQQTAAAAAPASTPTAGRRVAVHTLATAGLAILTALGPRSEVSAKGKNTRNHKAAKRRKRRRGQDGKTAAPSEASNPPVQDGAEVQRADSGGAGTTTAPYVSLWSGQWASNWTHLSAYRLLTGDSVPYLLAYKQGVGTAVIDRFRADGQGTNGLWRGGWAADWTHFLPLGKLGGSNPPKATYLFSYKRGAGTAAIDRLRSDGQNTDGVWRGQWSGDWTHCGVYDGRYLLSYKQGVGTAAIDRFLADGQGTTELWRGQWGGDWTHLIPFVAAGGYRDWYLLSYKKGSGAVVIDRLWGSSGTTEVWRGNWAGDWTHFVPFYVGSRAYLLSYKQGVGTAAIDEFDAYGRGTIGLWRGNWAADWTHFTTYDLGGPHLLSYKKGTGTVAIDKLVLP